MAAEKKIFYVCNGHACKANGVSFNVYKEFRRDLQERGLERDAEVRFCGCTSFCKYAQMVCVTPEGTAYSQVKVGDVKPIVESELLRGERYRPKEIKFHATSRHASS